MKALLTARGVRFPYVHDLVELSALLPAPDRAALHGLRLRMLNPYIVEGRYPGGALIGRAEAESAVAIAREARAIVRLLLGAAGPPSG